MTRDLIERLGLVVELAGVAVIVLGLVAAALHTAWAFAHGREIGWYAALRHALGRALLLGLEVLVAADIIRTVALDLTFQSIGILGLLVLVRTFLSWTLQLEVDGRWPWQGPSQSSRRVDAPAAPPKRVEDPIA